MNDHFIKIVRAPNCARMDIFPKKNKSSTDIQEKRNCPRKFDLEKAKKHEGTQVPEIIFRITDRLNRNLSADGLYLKQGNKEKVLKLRSNPAKIDFERQNLHDLTSLLKMILSEMEEPLLPKQIFETFKRTTNQSQIKGELYKLDPVRKETLDHLMRHLYRVSGKQNMNKMDRENMCTVWAPVVYYPLAKRSDAVKRKEFFGIIMNIYTEQIHIEQCQPYLSQIQANKDPKKRKSPQRKTPVKEEDNDSPERAKQSKPKAEITSNENTAEPKGELKAKQNGDQDTEEKREEEKVNDSTEDDKRLIVPAEELMVKEKGGGDTEEENENDSIEDDKRLIVPAEELMVKENRDGDTEEEKENDSIQDTKGLIIPTKKIKVDERGPDTEEKREDEKENISVKADTGLIAPAVELRVKGNGGCAIEEKREEEKENISMKANKGLIIPAIELNVKENGERAVEEKREGEKGKNPTEERLTGPAEELNIHDNEGHVIEERRAEEKGKDSTKDEITLKSDEEERHTTGLVREEHNANYL